MVFEELMDLQVPGTKQELQSQVKRVFQTVAGSMGHTPAVCRKSYVHPRLLASWQEGALAEWKASCPKDMPEEDCMFLRWWRETIIPGMP